MHSFYDLIKKGKVDYPTNLSKCGKICPEFTQHKAKLDGLLFDVSIGLCNVGAAAAEGVCQNRGHFHSVVHKSLKTVMQEMPAERTCMPLRSTSQACAEQC